MSKEKDNPYVTRGFCDERFNRIVEKIDGIKKQIYIAAAVTAFWVTLLNLAIYIFNKGA